MYVIGCCIALRKDDIPESPLKQRFYAGAGDWINVGDSAIVNPHGEIVAGPIHEMEGIIYAEIDPRQHADPSGCSTSPATTRGPTSSS